MGKVWTKEKLKLLKAYSENSELTKTDIALKFKTTADSIDHAQRRYGIKHITPVKIEKNFNSDFYSTYIGMLYTLKETMSATKPFKVKISSKKKRGDTLNVHITDWHVGRIIKDEYGEIVYDVNLFKKMVNQFMNELLKLVDKYISKGTPITDVKIHSTGDICDGAGIFATQETVSELSPPFQVVLASEIIQKLILAFLERDLSVEFYGVKGNHGEIRINGKNKDPNANWDLMLYLMLDFWARHVLKSDKLTVKYSELDYLNLVNRGWNYHLRHKAPNQSETSAGKAKFLGWANKHNFDVLIYGHLHHWGVWDRSKKTIIRGGALTAGDEFAESLAEESESVQLVWGCNESRPVSFIYPIDLGAKEKK